MATRAYPETRPYQGYPFVSPPVTDAPSVDAAAAARWAHLPRRALRAPGQAARPPAPGKHTSAVHIDVPKEAESDGVKVPGAALRPGRQEDVPVVYIQLPGEGDPGEETPTEDIGQENPAFVEETILFDPFENRQINVNKGKEPPEVDPGQGSSRGAPGYRRPAPPVTEAGGGRPPPRPAPPMSLNVHSPGFYGGTPSPNPGYPGKEAQVYGSQGGEEFSLTPLPVSDYPERPPAYSEVAPPAPPDPPRTIVVVPEAAGGGSRKLLECGRCRARVRTVVVPESGLHTHAVALCSLLLCLLPVVVLVYWTDLFKYRVHFCPNCNHKVGHEIPFLCRTMDEH